jgi:hypothetical protein
MTVNAYPYGFLGTSNTKYNVQDIGMFPINDPSPRISVVGYTENGPGFGRPVAWHGYVSGSFSSMKSNYYFRGDLEDFRHYKIKGNPYEDEFTGGYHQTPWEMSALFGTPLKSAPLCDHIPPDAYSIPVDLIWGTFNLVSMPFVPRLDDTFGWKPFEVLYDECTPFKGGASAPELIIPAEPESEIITYYDRITVRDTPANTNYQIFSIQGQLIQAGAATPDISTAQLSKGIYILRLENGKAFKVVK